MRRTTSPLFELVNRVRPVLLPSLVCAHRGDSLNAPENTLAAFRSAIEKDAELIELDVHETREGQVVVIHDMKVDRTTDGSGELSSFSFEELRELDAGSWFSEAFRGERIPTLGETLELCRGRAVPFIEMKEKLAKAPTLGRRVADCLKEHGMTREAILIVRDRARALEFQELVPETLVSMIAFTTYQARALIKAPNVTGALIYWQSVSAKLLAPLREAGMFVVPWTINERAGMERWLRLGAEAMITDCPATLRDLIEELESEGTLHDPGPAAGESNLLEPEAQAGEPALVELEREAKEDLLES